MAITGASRKQAGLYYDKGGAVVNALHPDFGITPNWDTFMEAFTYLKSLGRGTLDLGRADWSFANQANIDTVTGITVRSAGKISKSGGTSAACIFRLTNCVDFTLQVDGELDGGYTGASTGSNPVVQLGDPGMSGMLNKNIHLKIRKAKNGNHACITMFGETDTGEAGNQDIFLYPIVCERAGAGVFVYKGLKGLWAPSIVAKGVGANGLVLDTRAATDSNFVDSFPIEDVWIGYLRVQDILADAGFEPRGYVIKGACNRVTINSVDVQNVTANDVAARNVYGGLVAVSAGAGTGATGTASLTGTSVTSIAVGAGGSGYVTPPEVVITSPSGSGATAHAVLTAGVVTSIVVDTGGEGYLDVPYVNLFSGERPKNITLFEQRFENINDLGGTTGWPIYVQSGCENVVMKIIRAKNCKRGIRVDAPDTLHINDVITEDLPLQAGTFPVEIGGVSGTQPATNVKLGRVHAKRGQGLASATHAVSYNFVDRIDHDMLTQTGFDTGVLTVSSNAKHVLKCIPPDHGDADATLVAGLDAEVHKWATVLTANRTVTLSTARVYNGAKFRIVRTGLGAFTLNVGGLKTIPSATAAFVDVEHDGTAWRLTGYGTL